MMQFTTVLPHEPLPTITKIGNNSNNNHSLYGYIHLQGSFIPKQKTADTDTNNNTKQQHHHYCTKSNNVQYIESKIHSTITKLLPYWGLQCSDLLNVTAIISTSSCGGDNTSTHSSNGSSSSSNDPKKKKNVDQIVAASSSVNKIRLTISSPYVARTITSRLRRGLYTPRDLLASSEISLRVHHSRHDEEDEDEERVAAEEIVSIQIENDGLCQFGCGGRYSGKAIMVTQITPILLPESSSAISASQNNNNEEEEESKVRWERAAPPKFRKLQLTTTSNAIIDCTTSSRKGGSTKKVPPLLTEEELEVRRSNTRFVIVENILGDSQFVIVESSSKSSSLDEQGGEYNNNIESYSPQDLALGGDGIQNRIEEEEMAMKQSLLSILNGNDKTNSTSSKARSKSTTTTKTNDNNGRKALSRSNNKNDINERRSIQSIMEDDICHSFQEALRDALYRDGIVDDDNLLPTATTATATIAEGRIGHHEHQQHQNVTQEQQQSKQLLLRLARYDYW